MVNSIRLSLDKTLAYYFPELIGRIDNAEKITLRMMVQHRSGIPNYTNTPYFWTNPPKNNNEVLERVLDLPSNLEPGKKYEKNLTKTARSKVGNTAFYTGNLIEPKKTEIRKQKKHFVVILFSI